MHPELKIDLNAWQNRFAERVQSDAARDSTRDPAHDLAHFRRVVAAASRLAEAEGARLEVVVPAAWLHDFVNVPKNDPRRAQASRISAAAAVKFLSDEKYPETHFADIAHAIEAHSFSAAIEPRTLEAQIVQDADRLDALGAIGIARLFSVGAQMGGQFYHAEDPFARDRAYDDRAYAVDHFYVKLFKIAATLRTAAGRAEGARRIAFMRDYLRELGHEIGVAAPESEASR